MLNNYLLLTLFINLHYEKIEIYTVNNNDDSLYGGHLLGAGNMDKKRLCNV